MVSELYFFFHAGKRTFHLLTTSSFSKKRDLTYRAPLYRDLEEMMKEPEAELDHTTLYRWVRSIHTISSWYVGDWMKLKNMNKPQFIGNLFDVCTA